MAVHIKDELADIIGVPVCSSRIDSFVWISVAQKIQYLNNIQSISVNSGNSRNLIAGHLKQDQLTASQIIAGLQSRQIPEYHLDWIIDSRRQSHWIENYITSLIARSESRSPIPQTSTLAVPHHLLGRDRSIAIFDYWASIAHLAMQEKIECSKQMQTAWQDRTRLDRSFAWLDDGDADKKRAFFWDWLTSKSHLITFRHPQFQSHDELLIFFDESILDRSDKELFSKNAKKLWNQRQLRERLKGKKQCNFVLSEKTISKLKMLSKKHGLTRTDIIELIIESEAKDELYISERLRITSLLKPPLE